MFKALPVFPKYAATDEPWLPQVPAHWATPRMKVVVSEVSDKGHPDEPLLAATQSQGVIRKDQFESRTVEAMKALETLKLVCVDDFVVSLRSFQGGIERAHARGIISPAYTILRANERSDRDYLTLLFKSRSFIDALRLTVTGIREGQNIEYPRLSRARIPIPPPDEQRAIVTYLGHAHKRITDTINSKRRLIRLLRQQREVVVNEVVLRGVDSCMPLVNSGNKFVGSIPATWSLMRLVQVATPVQRTQYAHEGLLSVYLGRGVIPYGEGGKRVHAPSVDLSAYQLVEPGDLVMNNQQAWRGSVGVSNLQGIVSPAYFVATLSSSLNSAYARYLFASRRMIDQYVVASKGVGDIQRTLYWPYLRNAMVPLPSVSEQLAIVDRLDVEVATTDRAIEQVSSEIALLEEFRERLTTDVVTGRVDVRGVAAGLPPMNRTDLLAAAERGVSQDASNCLVEDLEDA